MVKPPDYHVHSCFSGDCETPLEDICRAAAACGMSEIAITDHVDFEPKDYCCGYFRPESFWEALTACRRIFRDELTIVAGVECGEGHLFRQQINDLLSQHEYDFVLASLHWAADRPVFAPAFFDGWSLEQGVAHYLTELQQLAAEADYDVLAHLDVIRRGAFRRFGITDLDFTPHESQLRALLRSVADRGKGIEVNTSYVNLGMGSAGPSLDILRWFREEGGRIVTLGSDAHRPAFVGFGFAAALATICAAGFEGITTFDRRRPTLIHLLNDEVAKAST